MTATAVIFALGWAASVVFGYKFGRHSEQSSTRRTRLCVFRMRSDWNKARTTIGEN